MNDRSAFHENPYGQETRELQPLHLQGRVKQAFRFG